MKKEKHELLDSIEKSLPFIVPENYFENFTIQMDSQITRKVVSVKNMIRSWLYMAAMFVGILFLGHAFYGIYHKRMKNNEKIELYILSQIDDVTLFDFYMEEPEYDE